MHGRKAVNPEEPGPDLPASIGGSPAEVGVWLWLTAGKKTMAAPVLGSIHWHEPSQRLPLAPPNNM